jgi:hypothetical protein
MLNRRPIFIDALAGSGSNLLWNILQSHPSVCSPVWETHELFQRGARAKLQGAVLAMLAGQGRFLQRQAFHARRPLTRAAAGYLDLCLFQAKLRTLTDADNTLCAPGRPYSPAQVAAARLVTKNLDGAVMATPEVSRIYPGACFIGLLRDGLALCESALRRSTVTSARAAGRRYVAVTRRLLTSSDTLPRYSLIRFEDLLRDPSRFVARVYRAVGLELLPDQPVRLKTREHYTAPGERGCVGPAGQKIWMPLEALPGFLNHRVNALQAGGLSMAQRRAFLSVAGDLMEELGYGI